jgi:hypothetical protein
VQAAFEGFEQITPARNIALQLGAQSRIAFAKVAQRCNALP